MGMIEGGGDGPHFSNLARQYAGSVEATLAARQEASMLEFRREAEVEALGGTLSEAQTAWDGLRDVFGNCLDAARLERRRLKLTGSASLVVPQTPGVASDPSETGLIVPTEVDVTLRPSPAIGFAPSQERAARWAVIRRSQAQAALASAILDNLGHVDVVVRAPRKSRGVDLNDPFWKRLSFKPPQVPVHLTDPWHFSERYDYTRNGNLDDSLIRADKAFWTETTTRDTAVMTEAAGWLATVAWNRPS